MQLLAIDPGDVESGIVIWEPKLESISFHGTLENVKVEKLIESWKLDFAVIEMLQNFGKNANAGLTLFNTCRWIGRFEKCLELKKVPCTLIARKTFVSRFTGSANSGDAKVRQTCINRYPKGTKAKPGITYRLTGDEWQAFGLALLLDDLLKLESVKTAKRKGAKE